MNEEAVAYIAIMRTFTAGLSGVLSDQSAAEVAARLADDGIDLDTDTVDDRLTYRGSGRRPRRARRAAGGGDCRRQCAPRARREHAAAASRVAEQERRESEAEQRLERSRTAARQAEGRADELGLSLAQSLQEWREHPAAIAFELPELTATGVAQLAGSARAAAEPSLAHWREELGAATAERTAAARTLADLASQRSDVQAQRDPSPPPPPWHRSRRDGEPGAPLWRLVDFAGHDTDEQRAAVESALEASGLLDAWVCPDGTALGADRTDVLLTVGPAFEGPTQLAGAGARARAGVAGQRGGRRRCARPHRMG